MFEQKYLFVCVVCMIFDFQLIKKSSQVFFIQQLAQLHKRTLVISEEIS